MIRSHFRRNLSGQLPGKKPEPAGACQKTIQSDISVNCFYRLPGGEACLAETREPQDLAQQKLLQGILQNLESSPYFVPDARCWTR